ncbi:TrmH family RNA methyltransferase [Streptococcus equinus]|uniref:RNA methyltransferase, TrmH family n=1 Tax=Streptococcus equinus ATCC 9812 TaxID=525379 RepID=E8JQ09_STREI|nr:RNA methyltransferase [Streptococcus equinus]EFW88737.1 RNA methyltransferase, TrmH family [Streptococcus equinus ATCC 9812]SUN57542.1 RNA methyltransferase [Streptococcus equinus]
MTIITSKSNNLIKKTKKLLKKKYREQSYLIEGWHLFEEAEKANAEFLNIFVLEDFADRVEHMSNVTFVTPEVLKELTDSKTPQGIIAEVAMPILPLANLKAGRYLVLEDVQDPGNVGTMIRTADAAGLDGVLISDKSADIYNQKTLRSMQGSHFHLPVWRTNVYEACETLQNLGVPIIATTLSKDSVDYKTVKHDGNFALVMGNEGNGISNKMTNQADVLAHIIMPGQAESLNVAVATGIVLFSLI